MGATETTLKLADAQSIMVRVSWSEQGTKDMVGAYRVNELVKAGPLGRSKIYELIARGTLPARKIDDVLFVLADDWADFLRRAPTAIEARMLHHEEPAADAA